jgi:hypothetical protein
MKWMQNYKTNVYLIFQWEISNFYCCLTFHQISKMPANDSDDENDSCVLVGTPLVDLLPGKCKEKSITIPLFHNLVLWTFAFFFFDEAFMNVHEHSLSFMNILFYMKIPFMNIHERLWMFVKDYECS